MKQHSFQYFRVKSLKTEAAIEFESFKDFHRFIEMHHQRSVFLLCTDIEATHFAIIHNGALLQQQTHGFKTMEDYLLAFENGFKSALDYYDALASGYSKYEDFKLVKEAGINDKHEFEKMQSCGFINGFKEMVTQQHNYLQTFTNPYDLYKHALSKGFSTFQHYKDAGSKGFSDAETYKLASEKNFNTADDYYDAIKRGFAIWEDLKLARDLKARDKDDLQKLDNLMLVQARVKCSLHESVLLVLLSKLPDNKKISINKLTELLERATDEYRYTDTKEMPLWFTTTLTDQAAIINFISTNENTKRYGHYDRDGEYFETKRLRDRDVVIDGSNVAHNSNGNKHSKPVLQNIILLAKELKQAGFTNISVISDASLKHRIADIDRLNELKELVKYMEAPAENPADIFIIQHVKLHHCLLISNDTFREWKTRDPWIAENIDFYRMSFMINGDSVLLPDMKDR